MNISFKRFFYFTILLLGSVTSSGVTDSLKVAKNKQYFDDISIKNVWANSINPAGLSFITIDQISNVEFNYNYANKELKSPVQPGFINSYNLKTEGYKKIEKLTFYGSFGYRNEHYKKFFFNNTLIFDPDGPYILGDTIEGKQQIEGFLLRGSVEYPLTGKIMIGIDADYQNYTGAKLKDPRNKNNISSFVITPGIIFSNGNISAGISGGPIIFNNEVSIDVLGDKKYSLFQFQGLGYFKSIQNITDYSNAYYGKGLRSEAQLRYQKGGYSNFILFNYQQYKEEVRYGTDFRLLDGISDKKEFSLKNYQNLTKKDILHQFNIQLNMMQLDGAEIVQIDTVINAGLYRYDSLITKSWVRGKQISSSYNGTLEYIITKYKETREKFRFNLGISAEYFNSSHYPVQTYGFQELINILAFAGYKKYITLPGFTIAPEIGLTYRKNMYRDMNYNVTDNSIPEFQQQDYLFRYSDFIRANAAITALKKTTIKFIPEYFVSMNSVFTHFPVNGSGAKKNIFINCSAGLVF